MSDQSASGDTSTLQPETLPLQGLRVLDLTRVLSGPFATMTLADLGAEVIKIEPPGGDDPRQGGPPFLGADSTYFLSVNRNKRGVVLNLKEEQGRQVLFDLAARADVVIENFRPGTAERLGIGYSDLRARNTRLVYASISGYGQTGPESRKAGYDAIAQARSGLMSITGDAGGSGVRVGNSTGDIYA